MEVYKFGGASINSIERIIALGNILQNAPQENLVVVVSAIGKTTNRLEIVVDNYLAKEFSKANQLFKDIWQSHLDIAQQLFAAEEYLIACTKAIESDSAKIVELLNAVPEETKADFYYDQIISIGEIWSTLILSHYLNAVNIKNTWIDSRRLITTDDNYKDATVDWLQTAMNIEQSQLRKTLSENIVITQGFIGSNQHQHTTSLGREGSDYSAAIFANLLDARQLTIWKDVEGIMNADPKVFPEAVFIAHLDYQEVIEMAFYGAQVIHPKTIKPLQNKNILLNVKSFLNPAQSGTMVNQHQPTQLPPIYVLKLNQTLLHLEEKNFHFVLDTYLISLLTILKKLHIRPNCLQTGAIGLDICMDDQARKMETFNQAIEAYFDIQATKNLTLLTIRNYTSATIKNLYQDKQVLLLQKTPKMIQVLYKTSAV